jgi:hypothetical protein
MRAFQGGLRSAFLCFFVSHIPITICIDGQAALAPYYPQFLRDLVSWYCSIFGDFLMKGEPAYEVWFSSLVWGELLFQLPFFFVAVSILRSYPGDDEAKKEDYPEWFRKACLVYGAHVSTTMAPILGSFFGSQEMTLTQKGMTTAIYSPYLIFPFLLMCYAAADDFREIGSPPSKKKRH